MAIRPLPPEEILTHVGTRHDMTGIQTPPIGMQDYYDWLMQTLHLLSDASCGALRVVRDDASTTTIRVMPGRASFDGDAVTYAGEAVDLADFNNQNVNVWLSNASGEAVLGYDTDSNGWPATTHLPLSLVTLSAGSVTQIDDLRFQTLFRV